MIKNICILCICYTTCSIQAAAHGDDPRKPTFRSLITRIFKQKKNKTISQPESSSSELPPPIPEVTGISKSNEKLRMAIYTDNVEEVAQLIADGADVNLCERFESNNQYYSPVISFPLGYASECANPAIIKLLLAAGADVNQSIPSESSLTLTPLLMIIFNNTLQRYPSFSPRAHLSIETLVNAGASATLPTHETMNCKTCGKGSLSSFILQADMPNRDAFPIIKALFNAGARNPILNCHDTIPRFYTTRVSERKKFTARATFLELYPGRTLRECIILSIIINAYSYNEETATTAQKQLTLLNGPKRFAHEQHIIQMCMQEGSKASTKHRHNEHVNPHPFFRLNYNWKLRNNVNSVAEWNPKYIKNARRYISKRKK